MINPLPADQILSPRKINPPGLDRSSIGRGSTPPENTNHPAWAFLSRIRLCRMIVNNLFIKRAVRRYFAQAGIDGLT
jgi:hypothetical protein